jgi:hypothetical protein
MARMLPISLLLICALLLCALGFLVLSFRHDLSSRALLLKILLRLGIQPRNLRAAQFASPYQRLANRSDAVHHSILLNLQTSDGSGQATHPDVLYLPEGFGEGNWPYWMACTPYPNRNAKFENPEIFVSRDGIHWRVPDGLSNPLVPSPSATGDHHSDPDMVFHQGCLWMFYRQTIRSKTPNENRLFLMKSWDGLRWSSPVEVLSDNTGRELLSPAAIHDGHEFVMWTVEIIGVPFEIVRRTSVDGVTWGAPAKCKVTGLEAPRHPWHIDVIQESGRLSAVLVSCIGQGGSKSRIHYAFSEDGGLSWSTQRFLLDQCYEFEADVQYRGCLLPSPEHAGEYDLWYSASCSRHFFSIAHVRLSRAHHLLLPSQMNAEQVHAS